MSAFRKHRWDSPFLLNDLKHDSLGQLPRYVLFHKPTSTFFQSRKGFLKVGKHFYLTMLSRFQAYHYKRTTLQAT